MIFGNINNLSKFPFLEEQVKECFEYAKTHDLASYEKGSHEIDGDRLFVNIVEYTTTTPEERFWEAHKNYLDVHVMIHGNEQIDLNFIQNMELKDFVEKDDFLPMDGEKNSSVVLTDGDFLICLSFHNHNSKGCLCRGQSQEYIVLPIWRYILISLSPVLYCLSIQI